ncbi:MAG TPA: hypothetical protein VL354_01620 [Spirochaetia bacterium]|nr:hypothetical protein [Spirochaetia bacterium]
MSLLVLGAVVGWADRKVIPFAADSQSLILSSSTIFSFKIEALSRKTGQGPDSVRTGNYDMSATVVKKYKGVVMEREG